MARPSGWFILAILAIVLPVGSAHSADPDQKRFYITPFVGSTIFDNDRRFFTGEEFADELYLGGRAGVRVLDPLWFELAGGHTRGKDCRADKVGWTHGSANLMLTSATPRLINPFLTLGGGWSILNHAREDTEDSGTLEAAGGLLVRVTDAMGVRLEARNVYSLSRTGCAPGRHNDIVVGAGLTFAFGGRETIEPERVEVTPVRPIEPPPRVVEPPPPPPRVESPIERELLDTGMIRLENINFDYDKATIRPEAHKVLDEVGEALSSWQGLVIEINGHTDSRGSDAYNLSLSQRRVESVRAYLLAHFPSLGAEQLTAWGHGESVPLVPNTTEANMQSNRRVEFVVLNKEVLERRK